MTAQPRTRAADTLRARTTAADAPAEALSPIKFIEINSKSEDGRRTYAGRFKYKVPTLAERVDIGALKAQLLQQTIPSDDSLVIAQMLAYLTVTIEEKSAPDWWRNSKSGAELFDYAPVTALYQEALVYEATFLGTGEKPAADREPAEKRSADGPQDDVGAEVQPSAERRTVIATFGTRGDGADPVDDGDREDDDAAADPDGFDAPAGG